LKNIFRLPAVLILPAFLLVPRVDTIFSATMPRKALVEALLLLLCGWAASRLGAGRRTASYAPPAVVAATLLFLFWMIPRSIDLTQIYFGANVLYVISLFSVGFLLSRYFPLLPGVARVAYALYFSSMLAAFGLLYASQATLLCSAFTLEDQHAFGWMLVSLGLVAYLCVLASLTRWLLPASESR
jgi:sugar phosphate permease